MSNAVACANRLRDAVLWVVAARVRAAPRSSVDRTLCRVLTGGYILRQILSYLIYRKGHVTHSVRGAVRVEAS